MRPQDFYFEHIGAVAREIELFFEQTVDMLAAQLVEYLQQATPQSLVDYQIIVDSWYAKTARINTYPDAVDLVKSGLIDLVLTGLIDLSQTGVNDLVRATDVGQYITAEPPDTGQFESVVGSAYTGATSAAYGNKSNGWFTRSVQSFSPDVPELQSKIK